MLRKVLFCFAIFVVAGPAAADDTTLCSTEVGDVAVAACTRAINSGTRRGEGDTDRFIADLTEPLLVEGRIVEDPRSDAGTVNGRVGVQWADQDLDLGVDALLLLGRLADNGEGTDTLAVKTLP